MVISLGSQSLTYKGDINKMAWRPQIDPYIVLPNEQGSPANNNSMAGNLISAPSIVGKLSMISYACVWTGSSPVGTISIEASDDFEYGPEGANSILNPGTWNVMPVSYYNGFTTSTVTTIPISGNTGNGMIDIAPTGIYAIRLIYTATSGTGNLTVTVSAKVS
jgi:hypothetical protein